MPKSLEEYSAEEVAQMASTYNSLLEHPETREVVLRATKHVNPALSIPELELKDMQRKTSKATEEKMASLENQIRERDARDRINGERAALTADGFTKDEIAEIEKVMTDEQIPNYGTAAKYYRNSRQVATPTPATGEAASSTYDLPQEALAAGKNGKQGLSKFARSQADAAMADIASGRIKLH